MRSLLHVVAAYLLVGSLMLRPLWAFRFGVRRSSSGRLLNEDGTVIDEGEAGDEDEDGDGLNVAAAAAKIGRR